MILQMQNTSHTSEKKVGETLLPPAQEPKQAFLHSTPCPSPLYKNYIYITWVRRNLPEHMPSSLFTHMAPSCGRRNAVKPGHGSGCQASIQRKLCIKGTKASMVPVNLGSIPSSSVTVKCELALFPHIGLNIFLLNSHTAQ